MPTTPSKLGLLQHIVKHVHFEPWKQGPITQADLQALQMLTGKMGPAGMAGVRAEAAEAVNELADLFFNESPYRRGTTYLAVQKQLTDVIIINYVGKANATLDTKDVAFVETQIANWFKGQIATHEFYIPCFMTPWPGASFSIGPIRFSHANDFASQAQSETGPLYELTFKSVFELMGRAAANWVATVKIDDCTKERAEEIANLAVDVALAGLQACIPEEGAQHMARMTGRAMPVFSESVSRSNGHLLSATTNSEPGLTLRKKIDAGTPVC